MEIITLIVLKLYKPIQIVAGDDHTILIHEKIYVWGKNKYGQLGLGDKVDRNYPQELPLCNIELISCGGYHTIALISNGQIYVWGRNDYGQLGLGDNIGRCSPQELILSQTRSIVCGGHHTIALIFQGSRDERISPSKIYVWGYNRFGQLGLGDEQNRNTPQELILDNVKSISCGVFHTIAMICHDVLYVWGYNEQGQLGLGDYSDRLSPQKLKLKISLSNIKSISCSGLSTIALTSDGNIYSWGHNYFGQLGLGDTNDRNVPHKILLCEIKAIDCRADHTIAITTSNKIYAWGNNSDYQLGLTTQSSYDDDYRTLPQDLNLNPNFKFDTVICGNKYTIVTTNTNNIYVWGHYKYGRPGLSDPSNINLPRQLNFDF